MREISIIEWAIYRHLYFWPRVFFFFKGERMAAESRFQTKLIKQLKKRFPGCMVMKTNPGYIQGLPDLLVLVGKRWAALEVKARRNAHHQPNQDFYISKLNKMGFARFIFPENMEEVLNEMEQSFRS